MKNNYKLTHDLVKAHKAEVKRQEAFFNYLCITLVLLLGGAVTMYFIS